MDDNNSGVYILILALGGLSARLYWLYKKEKNSKASLAEENRRLIGDNAVLEADHLKFQLQPHTLNNILANLKVIASKLNKGLDSLSDTLDYILYSGNSNLVSVREELGFIKKYIELNDLFISGVESIKIEDNDVNTKSKYYSTACIPHLITAYFIENAFKHGDINHPEFLRIGLKLTDSTFQMEVVNKVPVKAKESNGGLGLPNMKKRLELLLAGKYNITTEKTDEEYKSTLTVNF
jgi:LytS/YehU family sensor histidine kinase